MEFSRQEPWSEQPFPSPGYLPHLGIELRSLALQAEYLLSATRKAPANRRVHSKSVRVVVPVERGPWGWNMGLTSNKETGERVIQTSDDVPWTRSVVTPPSHVTLPSSNSPLTQASISLLANSFSHPHPCGQTTALMSFRYRGNPPSKCFMEHKGRLPGPTSLDSRRWRFVRMGQDDFRRGCPPCDGLTALGPREGFLPQIDHRAPQPSPKKRHAALCSKLSLAQQARKAFLADVEAQLTLHPLALYPDLEEDMPAEVTSCPRVVGGPSVGPGECWSLDAWGVPSKSEDDDCLPGESSGVWSSVSGNADDSTILPRSQPTLAQQPRNVWLVYLWNSTSQFCLWLLLGEKTVEELFSLASLILAWSWEVFLRSY